MENLPTNEPGVILVSGATGYIGGMLVKGLLDRGYHVRAMVRAHHPELKERWPNVEIAIADALDIESLKEAFKGAHTAYYLIHSLLLGPKDFEDAELTAAINFQQAAEHCRLKRIIYLGGLGDKQTDLSPHLRSRLKVAEELKNGAVPVTILRAATIIGSGSASYEIIRNLINVIPVFPLPRWARNECQPIAIRDIIKYLIGVLEKSITIGQEYDVGGREILTWEMMLHIQASIVEKKRYFLPSPVRSIRLYSYVASLATPVPVAITRALLEGIRNEVVCNSTALAEIIPFKTLSYREAVIAAMDMLKNDNVYSKWSDSYPPAHELAVKLSDLSDPPKFKSKFKTLTKKKPELLYDYICKIGGTEGWAHSNWMWRTRGFIDKLFFGVGSSRGRRTASGLRINDVVDFWRVEELTPNRQLLLRAEMKIPGHAWLEFQIDAQKFDTCVTATAHFETKSIWGVIYWYLFLPFHHFIFVDLLRTIERRA